MPLPGQAGGTHWLGKSKGTKAETHTEDALLFSDKGGENHCCEEFAVWSDNTETGPEGEREGTKLRGCKRR